MLKALFEKQMLEPELFPGPQNGKSKIKGGSQDVDPVLCVCDRCFTRRIFFCDRSSAQPSDPDGV